MKRLLNLWGVCYSIACCTGGHRKPLNTHAAEPYVSKPEQALDNTSQPVTKLAPKALEPKDPKPQMYLP